MVRRKPKSRLLLLSNLCVGAAILILLAGMGIAWTQHRNNQTAQHIPEGTLSATTEPLPSTEKPADSEFKDHQVAPDAPRYIFISKISVRTIVKPIGVTVTNQIKSPDNVFDVGWYNKSSKPDQPGAMLLNGHISSWETNGVFYELKRLRSGDEIRIERGDGITFTYKVVKSQIYDADKVDMDAALAPINPNKHGLNLITCAGKVIKGTNEFDKRLVVFAEQL